MAHFHFQLVHHVVREKPYMIYSMIWCTVYEDKQEDFKSAAIIILD